MTQQYHYWAYTLKGHNWKVHISSIYYSWNMEATLMSINRGKDEEVVVQIQWDITQQKKKKEHIWAVLVVVEPRAFYTEWSKSEREK